MHAEVEELKSDNGKDSFVRVELEDLGVKDLPAHVLHEIGEAAVRVVERYRRAGTACGHRQYGETGYCGTMICDQYVSRQGGRGERVEG